jgi:PAS domain S-box-containing protein
MSDLPIPVRDFIDSLTEDTRSPAYLLLNDEDRLTEWGGGLESYGVAGLQKGMRVDEHLSFLVGVLPLDTSSVFLPNLQTTEGVFADIYLFRRDHDTWVLFLDATAGAGKRQRLQQRSNELGLQVSDLEKESGSLGVAKHLLEQTVKEQTAELSMTVRRLQEELAEGRKIEQKLRQSEARFRSLYDSSMIGIMFYDVNGKITGANDAFLQSLGYSREDLALGRIEWSRIAGPGMRDTAEKPLEEKLDVLAGGPTEWRFLRKDGGTVTLLFGTRPMTDSDEKMVGFTVDLSQRGSSHQAGS